jgi:hypothetical protein
MLELGPLLELLVKLESSSGLLGELFSSKQDLDLPALALVALALVLGALALVPWVHPQEVG